MPEGYMQQTSPIGVLLVLTTNVATKRSVRRVTKHIPFKQVTFAETVEAGELEMMRCRPTIVIIDITSIDDSEIRSRYASFLLARPGWVKTYFLDRHPTEARIMTASELGVDGILRFPTSHFGINLLLRIAHRQSSESIASERDFKACLPTFDQMLRLLSSRRLEST